jgi:hypothetical protein
LIGYETVQMHVRPIRRRRRFGDMKVLTAGYRYPIMNNRAGLAGTKSTRLRTPQMSAAEREE